MKARRSMLGALAGVTATSLWGGLYVVSDVVLEVIPPFTLLTVRQLIAIPALAAVLWATGWPRLSRRQVLRLLALGVVSYGVSVGAQYVGTKLSTGANGALITSATPAFVVLFAAPLLKEPLTSRRLAALASATLGVVIVINPAQASLSPDTLWGNIVLLIATVTWALYSVLAKGATREHSSLTVVVVAMAGGWLLVAPLVPFELARTPVGPLTPAIGLGMLYMALVASAAGTYLWTKSLELLDAGVASMTIFAQPIVGALLSFLLLGEKLSVGFFLGGALVLLGVALVSMHEPGRVPAHADMTP